MSTALLPVRRAAASVTTMPQLMTSAVVALRDCKLTIAEYGILLACQRDDKTKYALGPQECPPHELLILGKLESEALIWYSTSTKKWELTGTGHALLDVVAILANGELPKPKRCQVLPFPKKTDFPLDREGLTHQTPQ